MNKWRPEGWKSPYEESIMSPTMSTKMQALTHNKAFEVGADAMLEAVCEEIEKVDLSRFAPASAVEATRKAILTLLRSKGQLVGPGMWGECPAGSTGEEGPPGADRD